MKIHALHSLLLLILGILALNVNAQLDTRSEDSRSSRQSDFDFPGPRRTPATLPVFHSGEGGGGGRGRRPRPFRPAVIDSGEGEIIDEGFQEPPQPPPRQSFRGSSSNDGSRFSSRPQFSEDIGNEADPGGRIKVQNVDGGLEEEKKEPEVDRLALLLQDSKFSCTEKKPGYYADDGLSCEVFHYCNEGVRHSWMCPAGTSFHQIHLICMQEGGDNICKQSSKYHFVNDYLYKPLTQATKENNGTIRYANRYFPEEGNPIQESVSDGFDGGQQQLHSGQQDDLGGFQKPSHQGSFRPSRPQSEEQFFAPPQQQHLSNDGGSRFRPSFDEGQFAPEPPQFSSGSRGRPVHQQDDLGAFGSDEGSHFQPPPQRVRGRPGRRNQGFPTFSQS